MKRLFALALVLCMVFMLCACKEDAPPKEPSATSTPLLYKVTDGDGDVIWLFGSIHVGRPEFYPLPDYVLEAYDSADSIGFEFDVIAYQADVQLQVESLSAMLYRDGTTIRDHISAQLYEDAVAVMTEGGIYNEMMDYYHPVIWSSMIDSALVERSGGQTDLGVDMHLLQKAHDEGKPVEELESAKFQMDMLGSFSKELQIILLESSVAAFGDLEAAKKELNGMLDAWLQGDPDLVESAFSDDTSDMDSQEAELYTEFSQAMITDRNLSMTDYAEAALEAGREVFICVGAAHIVGEGAMADLLAQRGYTVEIVTE